jgi:putative hydrolase of the HAD superfamily
LRNQPVNLDWDSIETVLLDMDGTLLDLHFDYYFWTQHLPQKYSQVQGIELPKAISFISDKLAEKQGQLEWYCTDYWSDQFQMDIIQAQQEIKHLIAERDNAIEFLQKLDSMKKKRILITNSDRPSIELKFAHSAIQAELDQVVSSHDYGVAKEQQEFWVQLRAQIDFNPNTALFIDDSETVLDSAQQFGLKQLLSIKQPISSQIRVEDSKYPMVENFMHLFNGNNNG